MDITWPGLIEVVCLGEVLVDIFAPDGQSIKDAQHFERAPGGAPANVAVALSKLGLRSGFIGKVGNDPFGQLLREVLANAHVEVTHLYGSPDARTTLAWVAKPNPQISEFLFYRHPGADALLDISDLDPGYLRQAKIFHFGSVSLSAEPARSATLRAAEISRAAGVLISYDPNWRPLLWSSQEEGREWILKGLALADIVKVNEAELAFVTGYTEFPEGSRWLMQQGAKLVIVTCGDQGAYYSTQRVEGYVPAIPIHAVDTTGSGDAFVGALLSRVILNTQAISQWTRQELHEAVFFANAAGAFTATRRGVIPALGTRTEIESFIHRWRI
jgi:fructokinase